MNGDLTIRTMDCADGIKKISIRTSGRPEVAISLSCKESQAPKISATVQLLDMSLEEARLLILAMEKAIELALAGCGLEAKTD